MNISPISENKDIVGELERKTSIAIESLIKKYNIKDFDVFNGLTTKQFEKLIMPYLWSVKSRSSAARREEILRFLSHRGVYFTDEDSFKGTGGLLAFYINKYPHFVQTILKFINLGFKSLNDIKKISFSKLNEQCRVNYININEIMDFLKVVDRLPVMNAEDNKLLDDLKELDWKEKEPTG